MSEDTQKKSKVKKIVIGTLVAILIIAAGILTYNYASKNEGSFSLTEVQAMGADLSMVEGNVLVKKANTDKFVEAAQGDAIHKEDSVKTLENSKAVLVFDTGDVVRLNEKTEIKVDDVSAELVSIENLTGEIFSRVEKSETKKFQVLTDGYPAQALGTVYTTSYDAKAKLAVNKVLESKIKVGSKDAKEVDSGQKAELNTKDGNIEVKDLENSDIDYDFYKWNKELEEEAGTKLTAYDKIAEREQQKAEEQQQEQEQAEVNSEYLYLNAWQTENGVALNWEINGIDAPYGFKVLKAENGQTPVYPGSAYQYLSNTSTRSYEWGLTNGATYNFRVCTYNGNGGCINYSNIVSVTAPYKEKETSESTGSVNSISLSASAIGGGKVSVSWSVDGTSAKGFKVVWSKNSGPTYPCRSGDSYHYLSSPSATSDNITGLEVGQTYYIRVCEYLGGQCGVYSNEVSVVAN